MDLTVNFENGDFEIEPSFEGHLGKRILKKLKEHGDEIHQIDIATDEKETHASVRMRSIRVAQALRARNLNVGDVVIIQAENHKDASIPFISSLYLGLTPLCLATGMTYYELKHFITNANPKIFFVDPSEVDQTNDLLTELKINAEIIVFGECDNSNHTLFSEISKKTDTEESFQCEEFNPETTMAFAVCSSGSTGLPKIIITTHKTISIQMVLPLIYFRKENNTAFNFVGSKFMYFSPLCWISGLSFLIISCIYGNVRIHSSKSYTHEIAKKAIDLYKPNALFLNTLTLNGLAKYLNENNFKLDSLIDVYTGGNALNSDSINDFLKCIPNGKVISMYGATEIGIVMATISFDQHLGKIKPWVEWKVVDIETEEVLGPNKIGELRVQSVQQFKGYFNDPKSTKNAYDNDNYFKTGDMFYYDEDRNFYFVDRCKAVMKYLHQQIAAAELENMIYKLPEVLYVGVVGLKEPSVGEVPMAFVQTFPGKILTPQAVKDIIKDNLSDYKQLRGGVVFLDKMPLTHSGKLNRAKLNELKYTMKGI